MRKNGKNKERRSLFGEESQSAEQNNGPLLNESSMTQKGEHHTKYNIIIRRKWMGMELTLAWHGMEWNAKIAI